MSNPGDRIIELADLQYSSVLRAVKKERVIARQIKVAAEAIMTRLSIQPDLEQVFNGPTEGSAQVNVGDIINWMDSIQSDSDLAIEQLIQIHATAVAQCL